jgi:hypothetical protein
LDHIAFAEENPTEYRILFLSARPPAAVKKTRQEIQENNPAFRLLFKCVQSCLEAGVLRGDAFAISTTALTSDVPDDGKTHLIGLFLKLRRQANCP